VFPFRQVCEARISLVTFCRRPPNPRRTRSASTFFQTRGYAVVPFHRVPHIGVGLSYCIGLRRLFHRKRQHVVAHAFEVPARIRERNVSSFGDCFSGAAGGHDVAEYAPGAPLDAILPLLVRNVHVFAPGESWRAPRASY
jgi:hypothetical protein